MQRFHLSHVMRFAAALLITATMVTACGGEGQPPAKAATTVPPAVPVELLVLKEQPIKRANEYVAAIRSLSSTTVQPQAEGFLTRVLVTSGARVSPGMSMFEIDSTTQRAALASLEAQRASREADATLARQEAERAQRLLDGGAISRQAYEQAQAQQQNTEAQLLSIEDQIRQQQAELAYHEVTAQTAGVVGDVPVRVGDRVTRATVLTTIDGNTGLEAHINVPTQQAPQLRLRLPVQILDDAGGTLLETQVSFVAPSVSDTTQSVLVKAPVSVRGQMLRVNQFVRARIVWGADEGLLVPVMAVQRIGSQQFVFVAEALDGGLVARQRPVTLGPIVDSAYPVLSGLSEGDQLVLAGTQKIGDGAPVQTLPTGPPPGAPVGPPGDLPPDGAASPPGAR